jgi:hypothetical protein
VCLPRCNQLICGVVEGPDTKTPNFSDEFLN